jgi:hypothetical protein
MLQRSGFIEPCLPSLAEGPPTEPQWLHEIKHDSYRLMARRDPRLRRARGGAVVGRSFLSAGRTRGDAVDVATGHNGDIHRAAYGYEPTRGAAMAAFKKSWRRG